MFGRNEGHSMGCGIWHKQNFLIITQLTRAQPKALSKSCIGTA